MAQVSGTTDTYDIVGIAEDIEDIIYNISPTETPAMTMADRGKAKSTLHQWQTDTLAAAAANRQIEGDDASYATFAPTVMLSNYTQISRKTMLISDTADAVRMYGRERESARLLVKNGRELKRDMEYAMVRNQASSAGGSGTARSSAGLESMITNKIVPTTASAHTTPGYATGVWAAPTDGTMTGAGSTFTEDMLKNAIDLAWQDGGDPSIMMMNTYQKRVLSTFAGANKFVGTYQTGSRTAQSALVGAVDLYISDVGEHKVKLNRYMRQSVIFLLDPEYLEVSWLRRIAPVPLAKTGDATKTMLRGEFTLVVGAPDAHAKIADLYSV